VFAFVGVVSFQSLWINGYHHWKWLLLWSTRPLGSLHNDFPFVYFNKLYYVKICLTLVMERQERRLLRLVLVSVVVTRWSNDLFIILTIRAACIVLLSMII
jgi:hypothetical protein